MMAQLHQELNEKEVALAKLRVVLQETKEEKKPSITIAEYNTMNKKSMVRSPSLDLSLEKLGDFENHTRGISSKILM
jgi:hypothetical protein